MVELLADENVLAGRTVRRVGLTDQFVEHGKPKELRARAGIDKGGIKRAVLEVAGKTPSP